MGESPLLEVRSVERRFPADPPVYALREASFDIQRGDYVAVVGKSGSGKSTLLSVLGLLDQPTSGSYRIDGVDTETLSERARTRMRGTLIGFVFQSFHLMTHRTVVENVKVNAMYSGCPRAERARLANAALDRVGLTDRALATAATLSGGEAQRVAIARAVVCRPQLLLCDEPTGDLDTATSGEVMDLFEQLNSAGHTLIVVTHDPDVAARAKRTLVVSDGVVAER